MKKNINTRNVRQPFSIPEKILNISNQNIHNLIYSSLFHWDEESITTAYLGSIYGQSYSVDGNCFQCGLHITNCPNGNTPQLNTKARIASFNKKQESKHSGSDFLLSYKRSNQSISRIFIQAKVIRSDQKMNITAWEKIFHKKFAQYNKIIKYSHQKLADPYYLFYVLDDSPHFSSQALCNIHTNPYDTFALLIKASSLTSIHQSKSSWSYSKDTFNNTIAPHAIPLTCIFKHHPNMNSNINHSFPTGTISTIFNRKDDSIITGALNANIDEEIPEVIIDEKLIEASELKEKSYNYDFPFNAKESLLPSSPDDLSINMILNLLANNEFTTFNDIAKVYSNDKINKNSILTSVRNIILSSKILPEDAVKVVGQKYIKKNNSIDLNGEFNSYYGYTDKITVINKFYPYLSISNGFIKIGENSNQAKYIDSKKLIEKILNRFNK
ncbi:hypothetical protein [Rothia terrae]|uniref:Uncharacterized protein n=1 Tax=Rothia terrae TaxID=396015 RepID=A0A7H2BBH2_9MICC|nr:hypothetical protein [Rothia terrae]QNV37018.1 hypothetical protein IDM49_07030 [Rothia terrae]